MLLLALAVFFIFFVARGCVATQEATEVRKYVTGSNSLLTDSSNLGREKLQPLLQQSNGEPGQIDEEAMDQVVEQSGRLYQQAEENGEVPPEFDEANNYLVSTLGVRATATRQLQRALSGDTGGSGNALSAAIEDYRTSDSLAQQHYFPASENALEEAGQQEDRNYLEEPRAFMNYRDLGFDESGATAGDGETGGDPNALHDVHVSGVEVAGQQLSADGTVVLSGPQEPVFTVAVTNSGEVAEKNVPVEVVLDTRAGRQANSERIKNTQPGAEASVVKISGFRPGELDEAAEVFVEAGPVEYEELTDDNVLTGWVTFGL